MVPKMKTHAESYQKRHQDINPKKMQYYPTIIQLKIKWKKNYLVLQPLDQPR